MVMGLMKMVMVVDGVQNGVEMLAKWRLCDLGGFHKILGEFVARMVGLMKF